MSEWQNFKLREVGTLQRGRSRHRPRYAFHLFNGPYPFIQTGEVREARKYVSTFENTYSEAGLAQSKLWPKGTLCITIAANIAELAILGFDACFPDSVLGFIPDETRSDLDFVYYTLTHFQKQLKHIGEGSVQDNINLGTFEDIEFPFPSLPEQKAIASVLSSLDDKIDLLHRQNKTLEAMAETLFRQWFIEEAKEDWEYVELGSVVETSSGGTPSRKEMSYYENGSIHWVKSKELNGSFITETEEMITDEAVKKSSAKLLPAYSTLIAMYGATVGEYALITKTMTCNQAVCALKENEAYPYTFIFMYVKNQKDELINQAVGSAQQNISQILIKKLPIPTCTARINEYHQLVIPWFKKMQLNVEQIQILEKLRDTLLPKLMSGEVRVQYQTEEVA